MSSSDESSAQPGANETRAEPSLTTLDEDLITFALPTSSSSRDIEALVQRNPLTALIAAVGLGIVIGRLLR